MEWVRDWLCTPDCQKDMREVVAQGFQAVNMTTHPTMHFRPHVNAAHTLSNSNCENLLLPRWPLEPTGRSTPHCAPSLSSCSLQPSHILGKVPLLAQSVTSPFSLLIWILFGESQTNTENDEWLLVQHRKYVALGSPSDGTAFLQKQTCVPEVCPCIKTWKGAGENHAALAPNQVSVLFERKTKVLSNLKANLGQRCKWGEAA